MFAFETGARVRHKDGIPGLDLLPGTEGVIWATYDLEKPAYEVTFEPSNGSAFGMVVDEDELELVDPNETVECVIRSLATHES